MPNNITKCKKEHRCSIFFKKLTNKQREKLIFAMPMPVSRSPNGLYAIFLIDCCIKFVLIFFSLHVNQQGYF